MGQSLCKVQIRDIGLHLRLKTLFFVDCQLLSSNFTARSVRSKNIQKLYVGLRIRSIE